MNFSTKVKQNVFFVRYEGDLIGPEQNEDLNRLIEEQIAAGVLACAIDISEVRYINSTGIAMLLVLLTRFRNKGGEVLLINPSQHVQKLLIITKLNAIFTIVSSEQEAIDTLLKINKQ
ncbi:STAS domain-containing protein [Roseivirga sp. BDSF3-8]|uniref:STAS domain-containing protein n=1 Tax=Roseivirga sp. BDSF3-8 TaxID=3241598 RepID=UPI0035318CA7